MLEIYLDKIVERYYANTPYYASEIIKEVTMQELEEYVNAALEGKYKLNVERVVKQFKDGEFEDYKLQIVKIHEDN